MWATVTGVVLLAGFLVGQKRAPEIKEIEKTDNHMEMILYLAQCTSDEVHVYFRRPREEVLWVPKGDEVFVTFYSPRRGAPPKLAPNDFRFSLGKQGLYKNLVCLLQVLEYEMPDRHLTIHFGWPLSSWLDRISIGVMVFKLMQLPRLFSHFNFNIAYQRKPRSD